MKGIAERFQKKNQKKQVREEKRKLQLDAVESPSYEKRQRYTGKYEDNLSSDDNDSVSDPEWVEDISERTKYYRAKSDSKNVIISIDRDTFLDNIALISDKTITTSRTAVQIIGATLSTANISENN